MRTIFILFSITSFLLISILGYFFHWAFYFLLVVAIPIFLIGVYDIFQKKHAILKNFPLVGRSRYILEWFRPKIYQYFIEPDYDGRPFSRINRSLVYSRAKKEIDTTPFGTPTLFKKQCRCSTLEFCNMI